MAKQNKELRRAGLKVTLPRLKILEILESDVTPQHMSADDVYRELLNAGDKLCGSPLPITLRALNVASLDGRRVTLTK